MSFTLLSSKSQKARKTYRCIWCPENIEAGTHYVADAGIFGGEFQSNRFHSECHAVMITNSGNELEDGWDAHMFRRGSNEVA